MKENSIAKRYAKGLIKTIKDESQYREVRKQLEEFSKLMNSNPEFKAGMETMLFSKGQKKELLEAIHQKVQFNEKTFNFLLILLEENRAAVLENVIEVVEELWLEINNIEKLNVFSAVELKSEVERKLIENLEKSFDKKIILDKKIDPTLIAGIKIQRGSVFYDFSIEGNLQKLKEALLSGAY